MNDWAEFRHFKYLLAVMEHRGFRAAAEYLRTAPPNLSTQAKQFQEFFSIQLFRIGRDRRLILTETGIAFMPIARALLDARDEAIAALKAIEQGALRTLRFGCGSFVDPALFQTACELHKEIAPGCVIRPEHEDTVHLIAEIASGELDAAIVTLPVTDSDLRVEELRHDRLVVCLRADHPLATKMTLQPADLQSNLTVLYHPQRHPEAHARLLELLGEAGVRIEEYSRASHPSEMQALVKQRYGFALIREGTVLDKELVTRPIAGVDWTVDTAFVYGKKSHPKTVPVLVRHLRRRLAPPKSTNGPTVVVAVPSSSANGTGKRPPRSAAKNPSQMSLLG